MTTGMDFDAVTLPAPRVDEAWARRVVRESFGIDAVAHQLGSNQDANFLIRTPDGRPVAVLKVSNPAFGAAEVTVQDDAADRIAASCPELRVAQVLRGDDGVAQRITVATPDGPAVARLIRFLDGGTLFDRGYLDPRSVARLGEVAAKVDLALADITDGNGLDRVLQWDLQYAVRTVATLGSSLPAARRAEIATAAARAWHLLAPLVPDLPVQVVHLDLTDDNTVLGADGLVDGVIDFSDLTRTWTVCELAIAISSILHHPGAEPASVLPAVRAYHSLRPLSEAEVMAIWPLVVLRAGVLVASGCHQVAVDGDNAYAETRLIREWRIAEQALSVPPEVMTAMIGDALGLGAIRGAAAAPVPDGVLLALPDAAVLDLSPQSSWLDGGAWENAEIPEVLAADLLAAGHRAVVTRFGEARLAGSGVLVHAQPATVATGIDLWTAGSEELRAPWDCEVSSDESGIVLLADGFELVAHGVVASATGAVGAGTVVATTVPSGRTRITAGLRAGGVPEGVAAQYARGWLATLADPAPLLGLPMTDAGDVGSAAESVLQQRERALAEVQEHYYREPPRIERGWRHFLITEEGRPLLDMINNIAVVGHSHPRLARTAERQLRLLNTNSRFNYEAIAEFSARLADLAPDPLDTVFLVNSGSEATDLAIRLALVATGRSDMVAMSEAYHGWTYASDAVSTSVADNPNALHTRPSWVHTVPAPNPYRGQHRGADATRYGPEAAAAIDELAASGQAPAGFIGEAYYGNAGGMPLPEGYLAAVYSAVRRHGGLTIADEIQVGYGRLGHWFWGFEQQGVVPDIIAVAKAVGNGVPVAAVITSRAVADKYRDAGYFFSSTGGSPLSSRIGLCVLDIIRDEDLQGNARTVGGHLKARLEALGQRHDIIGAVHGYGLYLGVELVRDRTTLEPASSETAAICDRMLDLGVVIQPTSDRMNVLKVKPPLCLDQAAADFFVDTLDRVLSEGW
ncbi:aminotransferase [Phycicoccus sp. Soil803]|uniref:aminotransferase n=1 Tax=Phycicoccus sp. Soil803 TaxID=1736415 RepID=UPI00070C9B02|nr:aminotransferase [Phycicoccus sp. Soil803]KRF26037.1 4-aminobutyrate aminotransferase [Phycicoccus sp. Soil803]